MQGPIRGVVAAAVLASLWTGESLAEFRTWRAATGDYSTVAEFVELKPGNTVSLRLKDGSLRELPIDKLSDADRAYLGSLPAAGATPAGKGSQRPAGAMQSPEAADRALKAVDKEVQRCRTADEAVVLYTVFLADETLPSATRATAEKNMAEWKQMADKGLVRSGSKWLTAEEVRGGRIKAAFLINQGLEMVRLGQDRLGYDKLMEASAAAPDDIYADFIIATVYAIALQKFDEAQKHYEVCLRRDPDNPSVLNNLALTEIKVGRHREALLHWKAAAALCEDRRIAQNLGRLFDQAGKGKILVSKSVLSQLSDIYASLVIAKHVSVAHAQLGWQYMLIPQEPPPDEAAPEAAPEAASSSPGDPLITVCGSGLVIAKQYVLTTRSATKGASDFVIADVLEKGKTLPAKLVASSKNSDLALLECPELKSPPLPAIAAPPHPGNDVLVAGYPLADAAG
ncbi:MAG TPA: trypsin-like peptidase domain-containing protein, partial [Pirellulales bacterium]|nr:trypsin-like peptidase domain-containing protein [Pirellulales bacterium]